MAASSKTILHEAKISLLYSAVIGFLLISIEIEDMEKAKKKDDK